MVTARAIDRLTPQGVIDKLKSRVAGSKVYISVDIDVLDPAYAPGKYASVETQLDTAKHSLLETNHSAATGTAEVGGWTTRELLTILDGLEGLEVVGADVGKNTSSRRNIQDAAADNYTVEVAPIYDNPGETTTLAASEVVLSLLTLMVNNPVKA